MSSLTDLVSKLQVYVKSDSHKQVFETGINILKKEPSNLKALRQCLVALISLDSYDKAVEFLKNHEGEFSSDADADALLVERAYIYYKAEDSESLSKLVAKASPAAAGNRGFQHIVAQHYYRVGNT